jgi:hypothetical protein
MRRLTWKLSATSARLPTEYPTGKENTRQSAHAESESESESESGGDCFSRNTDQWARGRRRRHRWEAGSWSGAIWRPSGNGCGGGGGGWWQLLNFLILFFFFFLDFFGDKKQIVWNTTLSKYAITNPLRPYIFTSTCKTHAGDSKYYTQGTCTEKTKHYVSAAPCPIWVKLILLLFCRSVPW